VAQADSDGLIITAGLWLKPAVLASPSLPVCGSNRQRHLGHHCLFGANRRDGSFAFYCFIIYFNLYFFVESLPIRC
jgi:hypothetical protein